MESNQLTVRARLAFTHLPVSVYTHDYKVDMHDVSKCQSERINDQSVSRILLRTTVFLTHDFYPRGFLWVAELSEPISVVPCPQRSSARLRAAEAFTAMQATPVSYPHPAR
jgi:hypothetical protein